MAKTKNPDVFSLDNLTPEERTLLARNEGLLRWVKARKKAGWKKRFENTLKRLLEKSRLQDGKNLTHELLKTPEDYERERATRRRMGGSDEDCPVCDGVGRDEDGDDCDQCHGTGRVWTYLDGSMDADGRP